MYIHISPIASNFFFKIWGNIITSNYLFWHKCIYSLFLILFLSSLYLNIILFVIPSPPWPLNPSVWIWRCLLIPTPTSDWLVDWNVTFAREVVTCAVFSNSTRSLWNPLLIVISNPWWHSQISSYQGVGMFSCRYV